MFVMRKLDGELTQVLRFFNLLCLIRLAECKARSFARRGARVANNADCRSRSDHRLARKELRAMTANAGIVSRKIGHVGKVALSRPRRRNLVARAASESLMLV